MRFKITFLGVLILLLNSCTGFQVHYDRTTLTPGGKPQPTPSVTAATTEISVNDLVILDGIHAPTLFQYAWNDWTPYQTALNEGQYQSISRYQEKPHYQIDVSISEDLESIQGKEEVLFLNNTGETLEEIVFRMYPDLFGSPSTITNVEANGQKTTAISSGNGSVFTVSLAQGLPPHGAVVISMEFKYVMPADPSSNYLVFAYTNDLLTLAHFYPMLAQFDEDGWHTEIPSPQGDVTYTDAAFYLVRVHAPLDATLVVSGTEIYHASTNKKQTVEYAIGPARDFFLAAGKNLEEKTSASNGVTIRSYGPPEDDFGNLLALDTAKKAIDTFSELIGPYPYSEFEVVATHTEALGVEYPGVTVINQKLFGVQKTADDKLTQVYLESTVAHEVGHQWFYNIIGDDQVNDPWLDEAITQYITYRYYMDNYGSSAGDGFLESLYSRWDRTDRAEVPIGKPVSMYSPEEYGSIIYGRGPIFFYTLQEDHGKPVMDKFLKAVYSDYAWQTVTTEDFKLELENACSCNLTKIFQGWVYP